VLSLRSCSRTVLISGMVVLLSCAVLAGSASAAGSPEERRAAASRLTVSQIRAQLDEARADRDGRLSALADAERTFATVMEAVGAAELAVQRQQLAVDYARGDLIALEARAEQQRKALAAQAEQLYKQGTTGNITALLEAVNPADALRRSVYAEAISRTERRAMERVSVARIAIDAQRKKLDSEEGSLTRVLAEQRALLADVAKIRDNAEIAAIASEQRLADLEDHLEVEDREVTSITRQSPSGGGAPAVGRGGWIWPAKGPITSGFGVRWGRMHKGIDIGAPTGAPILAARPGTVSYAGAMSGYGNVVIVDHLGGLSTLYAHQSAIAVRKGEQVGQGERIGSVGCTGRCTGPHLHFEIRVNGAARNPTSFL